MDKKKLVLSQFNLGFQWKTKDPFLFFAYHKDVYPKGSGSLGVNKQFLSGRNIGSDFELRDGFRMYHGQTIPGFPVHPHRGFETITIVNEGFADHADSMGASGRYGNGDVQWMTAGSGIQHSEMFPLIYENQENHLELFQIWLNLPKKSKMVPAHFKMLWSEKIPNVSEDNGNVKIKIISGNYKNKLSLTPPPDSWAADPNNRLMVLMVEIKNGGRWEIPTESDEVSRVLYFYSGSEMTLENAVIRGNTGLDLNSQQTGIVFARQGPVKFLILQAKPIKEPVAQHGPFVMTTKAEIINAFEDYERTKFGGWVWPRPDMVHGKDPIRFATLPDGRTEKPSVL